MTTAEHEGNNNNNNEGVSEQYQHAISEIKYHEGKKREWLVIAINALISGNFPRHKIAARLTRDLEGYVSDDYIRHVCLEYDCTDKEYNKASDGATGQQTVYDSQASGFKTAADSSGDNSPGAPAAASPYHVNTKPIPPPRNYPAENAAFIEHLEKKRALLGDIIHKLKTDDFYYVPVEPTSHSTKPAFTQAELDELSYHMQLNDQLEEICRQAWDKRNTIPTSTQALLAEAVIETSIKHATGIYLCKVKELFGLSSKQVTKTLKGIIRDVHYFYEPTTRDEALISGFYGEPCTVCNNWRVRYDIGGIVHCYHCEAEYHVQAKPVPAVTLSQEAIAEAGKELLGNE